MATKGREMKDVVRDDIERGAERGREELEPGDFTIAAVEDAARPEARGRRAMRPTESCWPAAHAAEPDEETHGRDHVRRHGVESTLAKARRTGQRSNRAR